MALTETQKNKIEEEEEYRSKVRSGKSHSEKKKTHPVVGCLLAILLIPIGFGVLIGIFSAITTPSNSDSSKPQTERGSELKAAANFTGTQFVITNLDEDDCVGASLNVNDKYSLEGYTLEKGQTYTVGAAEFTDGDSVRFNPFAMKPSTFSISCRGSNKLSYAVWVGQF